MRAACIRLRAVYMTTQKNAKPTASEVNPLLQPCTGCVTNSHVSDIVSEALEQVHHCDEENAQHVEGVSTHLTDLGFMLDDDASPARSTGL